MTSSFLIAAIYLHLHHVIFYAQNSQKLTWDQKKKLELWCLKLIQEDYENVWNNKPSFEKCINVSKRQSVDLHRKVFRPSQGRKCPFFLQLLWNYELLNAAISLHFISR